VILNLISGPRNVSTALMYSFAQRTDTRVLDEPFYAVYLSKTGLLHPGAEMILRTLSTDEQKVKAQIRLSETTGEKSILFVKNMAHHIEVLDDPLIPGAKNIFLIRDPIRILSSYAAVISHPDMRDIGIAYQYELFNRIRERGLNPLVLDSTYLLDDPVSVLAKLCAACALPFEQRMAHWPQGPKPYDGIWAPHWYESVHRTTGFERPRTHSRPLPGHLLSLCEKASSLYEKLRPFSLKA
jgi:hypothetical protein